jgi:hypothetical protein
MIPASTEIPTVIFAYARPEHLARALAALRGENLPRLIAFADGPKGAADAAQVARVRAILRAVDWAPVEIVERESNLGLGKSILAGVGEVARRYEAFVVFEDDLVCSPGFYAWMAAALRHYRDTPEVFSVTGWTHARVTPAEAGGRPYFDARGESWSWGAYARSWSGMNETALEKIEALRKRGVAPEVCGADLPAMAAREARDNLWAVRWLYHHLQHGGLCLRPPLALVRHAGFDAAATNAIADDTWAGATLAERAPEGGNWPAVKEARQCRELWRAAASARPGFARRAFARLGRMLGG